VAAAGCRRRTGRPDEIDRLVHPAGSELEMLVLTMLLRQ